MEEEIKTFDFDSIKNFDTLDVNIHSYNSTFYNTTGQDIYSFPFCSTFYHATEQDIHSFFGFVENFNRQTGIMTFHRNQCCFFTKFRIVKSNENQKGYLHTDFYFSGDKTSASRFMCDLIFGIPLDNPKVSNIYDPCVCEKPSDFTGELRCYKNCCRKEVAHICKEMSGNDPLGKCINPFHLRLKKHDQNQKDIHHDGTGRGGVFYGEDHHGGCKNLTKNVKLLVENKIADDLEGLTRQERAAKYDISSKDTVGDILNGRCRTRETGLDPEKIQEEKKALIKHVPEGMKICCKCHEEKHISEFNLKNGNPRSECRECQKIENKKRYNTVEYSFNTPNVTEGQMILAVSDMERLSRIQRAELAELDIMDVKLLEEGKLGSDITGISQPMFYENQSQKIKSVFKQDEKQIFHDNEKKAIQPSEERKRKCTVCNEWKDDNSSIFTTKYGKVQNQCRACKNRKPIVPRVITGTVLPNCKGCGDTNPEHFHASSRNRSGCQSKCIACTKKVRNPKRQKLDSSASSSNVIEIKNETKHDE